MLDNLDNKEPPTKNEPHDKEEDYSKGVSTIELLDNRVVIIPPTQWWLFFSLLAVTVYLVIWSIAGQISSRVQGWGVVGSQGSELLIVDAPHDGIVKRVLVEEGAFVQEGDLLLEMLEVSDDPTRHFQARRVYAPHAAKVITLTISAGRHVQREQVLLRLQTSGDALRGHIFLPFQDWQHMQTGQKAVLHTFGAQALEGKIVRVADSPQHRRQITAHWGEGVMLPRSGDVFYEVIFALNQPLAANPKQLGYSWLLSNKEQLLVGMPKKFSITIKTYAPLSLIFPWLDKGRG